MKRYLADTHALIWSFAAPKKLGSKAARVFETLGGTSQVHVATVSLWEVAELYDLGRIRLPQGFSAWREALAAFPGIHVEPLLGEDIECARQLRTLLDPFDRLIAGTALRLGVPLLSCDRRLAKERRLRVVW